MSKKFVAMCSEYAYRKAPKDIEFVYIINQVKYIEDMISRGALAYDNNIVETIRLLARYYRNYKGYSKAESEKKIYRYLESNWDDLAVGKLLRYIDKACSTNRVKNGQGGLPLRNIDGIYITQKEIKTIEQLELSTEEKNLLFAILCFSRLYDASNEANGRKVSHLFYVQNSVLRRCTGLKKGTDIDAMINNLHDQNLIGFIPNRDKFFYIKPNRQPIFSRQCLIVDDEGEPYFYIDNFDRLDLTYRKILGDKHIKQCECGKYFEANSNSQKKCKKCNPETKKSKNRKHKKI